MVYVNFTQATQFAFEQLKCDFKHRQFNNSAELCLIKHAERADKYAILKWNFVL